eukprot:1160146-Pelagomonas_calceolata.AAC.10
MDQSQCKLSRRSAFCGFSFCYITFFLYLYLQCPFVQPSSYAPATIQVDGLLARLTDGPGAAAARMQLAAMGVAAAWRMGRWELLQVRMRFQGFQMHKIIPHGMLLAMHRRASPSCFACAQPCPSSFCFWSSTCILAFCHIQMQASKHVCAHTQEYLSLVEDGWEVAGLSQQDEWELCMGALLAALHAGGWVDKSLRPSSARRHKGFTPIEFSACCLVYLRFTRLNRSLDSADDFCLQMRTQQTIFCQHMRIAAQKRASDVQSRKWKRVQLIILIRQRASISPCLRPRASHILPG